MKKTKKLFLSHSQKDKKLAEDFKALFESFEKYTKKRTEVFLSSNITSDQIESGEWKKNFEENLSNSDVVVVLVTPNSLNSRWVPYEIGYAFAKGIEIYPIGVRGVSPEDFFLNAYGMQKVEKVDGAIKMLSFLFDSDEGLTQLWCERFDDTVNELLEQCKERCVYFVGSEPETEKEDWTQKQKLIDDLLYHITTRLLDKQIKVSSFPSVEGVGAKVFEIAMKKSPNKYEISGLYGLDRAAEGKDINTIAWIDLLKNARESYLKNKSSMIIIGGNDHTSDEFYVADVIKHINHLEIFPIPCMGGFARRKFNEKIETYIKSEHPCCNCNYENKEKCDRIDKFIERLSKYIYINEADERES